MSLISTHQQVLNTDLYQLTMMAGYHEQALEHTASFELYVRRLPNQRNYLVAAGLEQALDYLEDISFEASEIAWLREHPAFAKISDSFFEMLAGFRFTGEIEALPEGTVFFPYEPVLRVTAPIIQAQLVETWLLSMVNYQISIASKAARIADVLDSYGVGGFSDFGSRRAHGPQAALLAARAAYIGGAVSTSNVMAGQRLDLPVVGTAAHSWTMAFPTEQEAFAAYHQSFPNNSILLVDTYDTLQGVEHAIQTGPIQGIRLDSGDFLSLSQQARQRLDAAGLNQAKIVVSGDMNEYKVRELLSQGAPIDIFGIGTELTTSIDAPSLGGVYKLVEMQKGIETHYALKLSASKRSYPGAKQVWREYDAAGLLLADTLGLASEARLGKALLEPVMQQGKRLKAPESMTEIQARCRQERASLPPHLRQLERVSAEQDYTVTQSAALEQLFATVSAQIKETNHAS